MDDKIYRVDPRMVTPVALAMALGAFLLIMEGTTRRGFLLLLLLSPFFYLGAEILVRKIVVGTTGITVSKLFRSVHLEWSDIQSLDAVRSGNKSFLIVQREEGGPVIITNTIRPFSDLVSSLVNAVPSGKVSSPVQDLLTDSPPKFGPVVQAWLVCLVFIALVVGKLLGYGQ
ncbi:MAG: PH domain-containing protein [Desulfomonilaceae bacterium]